MQAIARWIAPVFLLLGIGLLGVAVWLYIDQLPRAHALEVDRGALDALASRPLEPGEYDVTIRIRNTSAEPQGIVGFSPT